MNADGTLNLLEAARPHAPEATFIHMSTNKVYGDLPNELPLVETESRLELPADHPSDESLRRQIGKLLQFVRDSS